MHLNKLKILRLSIICTCFSIVQVAQAINVNLGEIPFTEGSTTAIASIEHPDYIATASIDGNLGGPGIVTGWAYNTHTSPQNIVWTWQNSPTATLSEGQSVAYYTYSISLHHSYNDKNTLREYTLSSGDSNNRALVTNYESVTNVLTSIISVDDAGTIKTTQPAGDPDIVDVHTLSFRSDTVINSISLNAALIPGWGNFNGFGNNFILGEVTGSVSAEVVPEPSTYALFVGMIAFLFIAYQKRANA